MQKTEAGLCIGEISLKWRM